MASIHQRGPAAEHAARYLELIRKEKVRDGWEEVLEPLFEGDADVAATWWRFLRERHDALEAMRLVLGIFDGPPPERLDEWAAALAEVPPRRDELPSGLDSRTFTWPAFAAASAMLHAGREPKARIYLAKAMAQQPDASVPLRFADYLAKRKQYKEAADWYGRAAKIAPGSALIVFLQGEALRRAGDDAAGRRLIELAHRMPLGSEAERGKLAMDLHDRGFHDDARRECDLVLTFGWHRYGHLGRILNLAARYAESGRDHARAAVLMERSIAGMLKFGLSFFDRSNYLLAAQEVRKRRLAVLLREGKFDAALEEALAVIAVLPGDLETTIATVPALDAAGRKKDADAMYSTVRKRYEDLLRDYPESAFGHNSLAWLAAACRRDLDDALVHAKAAVAAEPASDAFRDTLAEVHFRRGDSGQAIAIMKKCCELRPERVYFARQLARFTKGDRSIPIPHDE